MIQLQEEIELKKILNAIKEIEPNYKIPPIHMFYFDSSIRRRKAFGLAYSTGTICLSLRDIGEFNINNYQFIRTVVHEIVHLNYWDLGHNDPFYSINNYLFERVIELLKTKGEQK